MLKLNSRERGALLLTLALLGLFVLDRAVVSPLSDSWERLDQSLVKKRHQLAHDKELLADRKAIQQKYAAYADTQRGGSEGARSGGVTRMLKEIESLARSSGVKISDVRPQLSQGRSSSGASITLSVDAGWESMVRFLYQLQRSPELLQVERASMLRKSDDNSQLSGRFVIARGDDI